MTPTFNTSPNAYILGMIVGTIANLCLYVLMALALGAAFIIGQNLQAERLANEPTCYEDMPCFDCHTMGNLRCGPIP